MAVDLTPARNAVGALLVDRCLIRTPEVLDLVSLAAAWPKNVDVPCLVSERSNQGAPTDDSDDSYAYTHVGTLPWDVAPVPAEGDVLTVTASERDAALVDLHFVVRRVKVTSWLVSRKVLLERWVPTSTWPEEVVP